MLEPSLQQILMIPLSSSANPKRPLNPGEVRTHLFLFKFSVLIKNIFLIVAKESIIHEGSHFEPYFPFFDIVLELDSRPLCRGVD